MKYKVCYRNDRVKIFNTDVLYSLNMSVESSSPSCPVETGGSIPLSNGDTLFINERYGPLDPGQTGSPEYEGIGLSLASGNAFIAYLIIPINVGQHPQCQETGYGVFYDLNNFEYTNGNIIKIYDLEVDDLYDLTPEEMYWQESKYLNYGLSCTGVIIINGNNWELTSDSRYVGKTLTLASSEEVYVSGPSMEDGIGIYFTLSSGGYNTSYYIRDSEIIAQSSNNWFSQMVPENNDEIHIYVYDEGDDYSILNDNFSEDYVSEIVPELCKLKVVNGEWTILEDHSND